MDTKDSWSLEFDATAFPVPRGVEVRGENIKTSCNHLLRKGEASGRRELRNGRLQRDPCLPRLIKTGEIFNLPKPRADDRHSCGRRTVGNIRTPCNVTGPLRRQVNKA